MLKPRLIPVLLLKNGILVRSRTFSMHQSTGNPVEQVERFTAWKADELVYLDISREGAHDFRDTMSTIGTTTSGKNVEATLTADIEGVVREVAKRCMIPLTVGGQIRTLEDIRVRLKNGADKVSINTQALAHPEFISEGAREFGNQCIVVCIDVRYNDAQGTHEVYTGFGKTPTGLEPAAWAQEAERRGAGEILLQSIDRDGTGTGYDIGLIKKISSSVNIPVIALGGVGRFEHLVEGLTEGKASAVAAANIFHFTEQSIINAKKFMKNAGIDIRL